MQSAECVEKNRIGLRGTAQSERPNFTPFDRQKGSHRLIPCVEQSLGDHAERDAGRSESYTATLGELIEMQPRVLLKLFSLRAQVWLCRVKNVRRRAKPVLLQNRKQVFEMTKFSPIVHTLPPA